MVAQERVFLLGQSYGIYGDTEVKLVEKTYLNNLYVRLKRTTYITSMFPNMALLFYIQECKAKRYRWPLLRHGNNIAHQNETSAHTIVCPSVDSSQLFLIHQNVVLSTRVEVELAVFCYKDIHVDRNEDNMRVCLQSITSESLTVNRTQQIKYEIYSKEHRMARKNL